MPAPRVLRRLSLALVLALPWAGTTPVSAPHRQGGEELWVRRFTSPNDNLDFPCCIAASPDGSRAFVAGVVTHSGYNTDYATVAYSATTGARLWARYFAGGAGDDEPCAIAVSPDGSKVFVTGHSGCCSADDIVTIGYEAATGRELWTARYGPEVGEPDVATAIAASPDGTTVFVTGRSGNPTSAFDYATIAYDAATGAVRWEARYDQAELSDEANAMALSHDGSVLYVTGSSEHTLFEPDYATVAYQASTGAQLWVARYPGRLFSDDQATAVIVSPDDARVFVSGGSTVASPYGDWVTIAYEADTGAPDWIRRYDGPDSQSTESNPSLALGLGGSVLLVAGSSEGDYATVAYDAATGITRWVRRYDGPDSGYVELTGIASAPDGSTVYVTGTGSRGPDYATIAYDAATGTIEWARWYDHEGRDDGAYAVAVSPDGSAVYVTGSSGGGDSKKDWVTIKYEA